MTNPSISELMPGKTSYEDAAVFINGITLGYN
jgi:hypothetical protein